MVYWKGFSSDESDRTVEISFMVQSKQFFKWPERSDIIWLDVNDVLCIIDPPTATGKSNWMFKMDEASKQKAEILFAVWQGKNNDIN